MMITGTDATSALRALTGNDLRAVVGIDASIQGRSRGPYLERRLAAAVREPALHAQLAIDDEQGLAGYMLARVLEGEYGRTQPDLLIEVAGVRRDIQRRGIGTELLEALIAWARRRGIANVRTQATWTDHGMLQWLHRSGFTLSPNHVIDCTVDGGAYREARDTPSSRTVPDEPSREINYAGQAGNHFERLTRDIADVRSMRREDLPAIARIDRRITGRDRTLYIEHKLAEAMEDSGIRISLAVWLDDMAVGFLMARADLGDFGRAEPVAALDTIGVDPDYAHRGIGHALLSQLFINAGALQIERVETVVAPHDLALLGFLYDVGFVPSQRLPFMRHT